MTIRREADEEEYEDIDGGQRAILVRIQKFSEESGSIPVMIVN